MSVVGDSPDKIEHEIKKTIGKNGEMGELADF
jgi:hypothetical protein